MTRGLEPSLRPIWTAVGVVVRDLALPDADERRARVRVPARRAARRNRRLLKRCVTAVRAVDRHLDRGDFELDCLSEHAGLRPDRDLARDRRRRRLPEDETADGAAPEYGRV